MDDDRMLFNPTPEHVVALQPVLHVAPAASRRPGPTLSAEWPTRIEACPRESTGRNGCAKPDLVLGESALGLSFFVTKDEEYVRLYGVRGRMAFDLGERGHNYLLLTLARRRLADELNRLPGSQCGWVYQSDLAHDPSMSGSRLNLDVFRIRRQFAARGLSDAGIIERRATTRQIRVGVGRITITSI